MDKVSRIKVENNLKESVLKAVDEIGGFESFINKGETVLLKPNFNTADPAPASTDMGFLKAVVELIYERDAKIVMIGDSSTMSLNTRKVMEKIGVFDLEKMEIPPRIYNLDERKWIKKQVPNGKFLKTVSMSEFLERADKLILLPNLKTHSYAQFTGALKLSVGFMKPIERIRLHLKNLQEKIAELNKLVHPNLIIMDARKCFITKGPAEGRVEEPNLILASRSRVDIDIEGIKVIQEFKGNSLKNIDPFKMPQIQKSIEFGIDDYGKN